MLVTGKKNIIRHSTEFYLLPPLFRNNLQAWHNGDALVTQVASRNTNTIVVINSVAQLNMEQWIANPNGI